MLLRFSDSLISKSQTLPMIWTEHMTTGWFPSSLPSVMTCMIAKWCKARCCQSCQLSVYTNFDEIARVRLGDYCIIASHINMARGPDDHKLVPNQSELFIFQSLHDAIREGGTWDNYPKQECKRYCQVSFIYVARYHKLQGLYNLFCLWLSLSYNSWLWKKKTPNWP